MLTETLASYLPPPSDPNYSAYESSYPQYKHNLEERYPQVCETCEPRVRERIKATGYAAKTDHLRRMMERTKARGGRSRKPGWRDVVLFLGKMGWSISLMGQMWWNIMCVLVRREAGDELGRIEKDPSMFVCLRQAILNDVAEECETTAFRWARIALFLGLMSMWWNNRFIEKVRNSGGRMVGLRDYYKLQVIIITARASALWLFGGNWIVLDEARFRGVHLFLLVFTMLVSA